MIIDSWGPLFYCFLFLIIFFFWGGGLIFGLYWKKWGAVRWNNLLPLYIGRNFERPWNFQFRIWDKQFGYQPVLFPCNMRVCVYVIVWWAGRSPFHLEPFDTNALRFVCISLYTICVERLCMLGLTKIYETYLLFSSLISNSR